MRPLPIVVLIGLTALATACSGEGAATPDSGPIRADATTAIGADALSAGPDAQADAGSLGVDSGTSAIDAATPPDAAIQGVDAGSFPSPVGVTVSSEADALASYLINDAPPAWNIFSGTTVPIGRHFDLNHVSYTTALRFASVQIPPHATLTRAKLAFFPSNAVDSSHNLWINVYAEKAGDSAAFDPANYDSGRPDQRLRTTAFIDHWLVRCNDGCTDLTEYDCPQRKLDCWDPAVAFACPKDLKALVQEVVNLPDWTAGSALTILLVNSATDADGAKYQDHRTLVGYDPAATASAPQLTLEFTP